jgi:uncharacterized membrane protein YhaH (DUF805 family)
MFCEKCGTKLDEGTKFCLQCGAKTDAEGPAIAAPPPPGQPVQAANQYTAAAPQTYTAAGQNKNPWQYFCAVWKKYAVFNGRARRAEFWWFTLFNFIISFVLGFIEGFALTGMGINFYITDNFGLLSTLYNLAVLLPALALGVRRMHDCGKSGWYWLIPIYGWIVLPCTAGMSGPNQYGPDPKQTEG